jgi:methylthioribose-1-phosphate isomerase
LKLQNSSQIPIEQRPAEEILNFQGVQVAPKGMNVYNPAFDVTSAQNITAIITEKGIIQWPTKEKIKKLIKS